MDRKCRLLAMAVAASVCLVPRASQAQQPDSPGARIAGTPVGTKITYQGRIKRDGSVVDGLCDFRFRLYDGSDPASSTAIGDALTAIAVPVSEGLFTVLLDYGSESSAFGGDARWMEIEVGCPSPAISFARLAGRQPLTPSPYAITASSTNSLQGYAVSAAPPRKDDVLKWNGTTWTAEAVTAGRSYSAGAGLTLDPLSLTFSIAEGGLATSMLANGAVTSAKLAPDAVDGSKIVNDSIGASEVNKGQIQLRVSGTCGAGNAIRTVNQDGTVTCDPTSGWSLTGNSATNPAANFIGTTDSQPVVIRTNNTEAMRIRPTGSVGIGTASNPFSLGVLGDRIGLENGGRRLALRVDGSAVDIQSETHSILLHSSGGGACPFDCNNVLINPLAGEGNVGIGTSMPTDKLHVAGGSIYLDNGARSLELRADGGAADIKSRTNTVVLHSSGTGACPWGCNNVLLNPFAGEGDVGIGTVEPEGRLHVVGGAGYAINAQTSVADMSAVYALHEGGATGVGITARTGTGTGVHGESLGLGGTIGPPAGVGVAGRAMGAGGIGVRGSGGAFGVYAEGNLGASGTKSAVVTTQSYGKRKVYSVESPGVWFEDFGKSNLTNGVARIRIDPVLAQMVNLNVEYHVFLTPVGGWANLYVATKGPTSFEVRADGISKDVSFDYRLVAKRKGYENERLAPLTSTEAENARSR